MFFDLLAVRVWPVGELALVAAWPGETATTKTHISTDVSFLRLMSMRRSLPD